MKIVNKTNDTVGYLVTYSGGIISQSQILASGFINKGNALEFPVDAGINPLVYVKSVSQYNEGYFMAQPESSDGTVTVTVVAE